MINFEDFKTKQDLVKYLKADKDIACETAAEADKWIRRHVPPESHYQKKAMETIRRLVPSAFVWKAAAGPYGRGGIPDICAIINGRFYGFEIKRPFIGVLSKLQEQTIYKIQAAGGRVYVVSFPSEIERILQPEPKGVKKGGEP